MAVIPIEQKHLLEFGDFQVDRDQRVLLRDGDLIPLAPKVFDTLLALVESGGRVMEKDELLKKIWPTTFVEESSLARSVSTLRKVLGQDPDGQEYIQTIPKRGYRFIPEIRPVPEQLSEEVTAPPIRPKSGWSIAARAGALLLALILAGSAIVLLRTRGAAIGQLQIRSIAVLPLQNLSRFTGQDYFSDGITDALITSLAQIRALKVISRTSVMRYKGTSKPLPDIARELGVDAILEGSVQRDGNRVRISAQLVRGSTDAHLWAKNYDRDISDVLRLEGEVATAIAQEIEVQVTPEAARHFRSFPKIPTAAQEEYLLAQYEQGKRDETHLQQAIHHFERAIEIEPNFAAAYAGLAHAWLQRGVWGAVAFREPEVPARTAAFKAIELDPDLAEAHAVLAQLLMIYDWAWVTAEQEFHRAIELDPNGVYAHAYYAILLEGLGRFPEAISEVQRALTLDPLSATVESEYGRVLFRARRYEEAIRHLQRSIELDPQTYGSYWRLADVYEQIGRTQEALALIRQELQMRDAEPMQSAELASIYALIGRRGDAVNILSHVAGSDYYRGGAQTIALAYFALGDRDRGFQWLTRAFDQREMVLFIGIDPRYDNVRKDPRFEALVRRLNFPKGR
jgi:TolB-like protein/DNA-binding winged helix-turn-helix (wHTH) protein/Flp pilus assembly protein TadD